MDDSRQSQKKESFFLLLSIRALITLSLTYHPISAFSANGRSESTIAPNLPTFEKSSHQALQLTFFQEKTFKMAYDVFLANGNVEDAYQIALAAVQKRPSDNQWRERLVKAALWSNHSEVALLQWKYFIDHGLTPEKYIPQALTLARQLRNFDIEASILLKELKHSPNNKKLLLAYSKALQNQGLPHEAWNFLQKIPQVENDREYLQQLISIAQGLDDPETELKYLNRLTEIEHQTIHPEMEKAELLYMKNKLKSAYHLYRSILPEAPYKDIKFWSSYAQMALLSGYPQSSIAAYRHLLKMNQITEINLIELLMLESQNHQGTIAYLHARKSYEKFKSLNLAKFLLALGTQLHKWQAMYDFLKRIPPKQLAQLKNDPEYVIYFPEILARSGFLAQAYSEWETILQRAPHPETVQSAYLWFLMDQHDTKQLEFILKRWKYDLAAKPNLWRVYSGALTGIGHYKSALNRMLRHQVEVIQDDKALLDIADLLNQNDFPKPIYYHSRWLAYYKLSEELARQKEKPSLDQKLALSELLRNIAPASVVYQNLLTLSPRIFSNPEIDNSILAWALEQRNDALAKYLIEAHKLYRMHTPYWMLLTLALAHHDPMEMDRLVQNVPQLLPDRDKVVAAQRSGNIRAAESYAYESLKNHPYNKEMHDLFKETMLPHARKAMLGYGQEGYGPAAGPRIDVGARFFPTPSLAFAPYASKWSPHNTETSQLATPPHEDILWGLIAQKEIKNGRWEMNVAEHKSLERTYPLIFKWKQSLSSRLTTEATLSYHTLSPEGTALLLAGMKNEAKLALNYTWDSFNTIDIEGAIQQFLGQDKFHLGTGQWIRAHWQSKFYLDYPDWNFNLYGGGYHYSKKYGLLSPQLNQLVPVGQAADIAFYMPVSSLEMIITLGFGQSDALTSQYGLWEAFEERYTQDWKPYAEAGISYNNVFGLGPVLNAGLSGSFLGRDILSFYVEFTQNQQQGSQKNYTIGIRYENYF